MKNKLSILLFPLLLLIFVSCRKEINKIYYEGGTPPTLTASTTTVTLEPGLEANTAITLNWTNPDYMFTTGISSQDVTYTIEMDTLGGNFNSSNKFTTVVSKDLSLTYTVGELNSILGNTMLLQLNPRRAYTLQLRVIASISSAVELTSNVLSVNTTPFAPPPKVALPSSGNLYLVGGDALLGAWANPVPVPGQEFTQISPTQYQITITLSGGDNTNGNDQYLFLPVNGDWSNKYACNSTSAQSASGGTFGYNGSNSTWNDNFPGPTDPGKYIITVDFQIGKYTVVKTQ